MARSKGDPEPDTGHGGSRDRIPFNRPFIVGRELRYVSQAVEAGNLAGDGEFTRRCSEWMERSFGADKVLLTHSCTAALEMSAILANIAPGDEVIMPSYTFVSTANAFALRGARIRFIDIRDDTFNIDESQIEGAITERTRAIVPVHYAGIGAEMDAIMEIAERHHLLVIEDAAQGACATYKDRHLGTIGHLGAYSFHETKNLISGGAGALAVNDPELASRAEIVREKGTDRSRFLRGEVDRYSWVDLGSSYLASELAAAFLFAQLEESERISARRRSTFAYYLEALRPLEDEGLLQMPSCPEHSKHAGHMFYIRLGSQEVRDGLIAHLAEREIYAVFHYVPLHSSVMGRAVGYTKGELPLTDAVSSQLLRLPCFFELERHEQDRVIEGVGSYLRGSHRDSDDLRRQLWKRPACQRLRACRLRARHGPQLDQHRDRRPDPVDHALRLRRIRRRRHRGAAHRDARAGAAGVGRPQYRAALLGGTGLRHRSASAAFLEGTVHAVQLLRGHRARTPLFSHQRWH